MGLKRDWRRQKGWTWAWAHPTQCVTASVCPLQSQMRRAIKPEIPWTSASESDWDFQRA
jgi:hypothetical protein